MLILLRWLLHSRIAWQLYILLDRFCGSGNPYCGGFFVFGFGEVVGRYRRRVLLISTSISVQIINKRLAQAFGTSYGNVAHDAAMR